MKWEKWWREDATLQGQPCHLLITRRSLWLEGPTQTRTVVVLRPQGIHQSTPRVWMMYDRAELTQFKTGSNCCKSRSCKVKSWLVIGSVRLVVLGGRRLIAFPAVSWVDCCVMQLNCVSYRPYSRSFSLSLCSLSLPLSWILHCRRACVGGYYHWHCNGEVTNFKNTSVQLYLRTSR